MKSPEQEIIERFQKADFDSNEVRQNRIFAKVTARKQKAFPFYPALAGVLSVLVVAGVVLWNDNKFHPGYVDGGMGRGYYAQKEAAVMEIAEVEMQAMPAAAPQADMNMVFSNAARAEEKAELKAGRGGSARSAAKASMAGGAMGGGLAAAPAAFVEAPARQAMRQPLVTEESRQASIERLKMGIYHYNTGNYGKAKEEWQAALQLWPENIDAALGLKRLAAAGYTYEEPQETEFSEDICARLTSKYLFAQNEKHRLAYEAVRDSCRNIGDYDFKIKEYMDNFKEVMSGIKGRSAAAVKISVSEDDAVKLKKCIDKFSPRVNPITLDKTACLGKK